MALSVRRAVPADAEAAADVWLRSRHASVAVIPAPVHTDDDDVRDWFTTVVLPSRELWTFQTNLPARRFYERHGFIAVRWTDGASNEERAPDVRYVWGRHPEGAGHATESSSGGLGPPWPGGPPSS